MKKIKLLVSLFTLAIFKLSAQTILNEGFESGISTPLISVVSAGTFQSGPGVIPNTSFGSSQVFTFGKSTCSSNCFNNYMTSLIITFPTPTFVAEISWQEMEIGGNWGSQGQLLLDDVPYALNTLGALPINSGTPDASPRLQSFSINQTLSSIKLTVVDITSSSEIILDDLQINYTPVAQIIGYEYWFNNDYANKIVTPVTPTQQLTINQDVSSNGLSEGLNTFNFRSFDNLGRYSSVLSHFFYKTNAAQNNPTPQILAYQYWMDTDFANAITVNTTNQLQVNINDLIVTNAMSNGLHQFNIRFKDNNNAWSSVVSSFFYKKPAQVIAQNLMTEYRYWFDADFANAQYGSTPVNQQVNVIDNLDLTQLSKGMHELHLQFKDTTGLWSVVLSDSIQKLSLPIADFTFSQLITCDSTTVTFTDHSIDGDVITWDFGDGTTSSLSNPQHTYHLPGSYLVTQTVSDTTALLDSTIVQTITITGNTFASIQATTCGFYTSPSGEIYSNSGVFNDTIPNHLGCDSIITVNLTILPLPNTLVTQNDITLTANQAGASYQWLDCSDGFAMIIGETNQVFTANQNGSYAVEITQNGCVDTSACYAITTVGILENSFDTNIIVYPNPTDGLVKIDLGELISEFSVRLTDINGKLLIQQSYQHTKWFEMNLDFEPGVYMLTIYTESKKAVFRLIKN